MNLVPIASGGGLQNALSFIEQYSVARAEPSFDDVLFLTRAGSTLELACRRLRIDVVGVRDGLLPRILFEVLDSRRWASAGDVVFTLFGPPPLGILNRTYNISGCAYANLLYPELNFWVHESFFGRIKHQAVDRYRLYMLSRCDELIFETTDILGRALAHKSLRHKKLHLVEMSPSSLVDRARVDQSRAERYRAQMGRPGRLRLLYLSGAHRNKRHASLVPIVRELQMKGHESVLITTLPDGSYLDELVAAARKHGVQDSLINVGPIGSEHVASLIAECDVLVNVALLESFSNNFVEAWEMKKALIVTDSSWARNSCRDAALYIDIESPVEAASLIKNMLAPDVLSELVRAGTRRLKELPSRSERFRETVAIIEEAGW